MKFGKRYNFGDAVIVTVQFVDTLELKKRPALVLFEDMGNIVVAGITSNPKIKGVSITKKEGMAVNSVIKLNYIFTISEKMVEKVLFSISADKKKMIKDELFKMIN